MFPIRIRIRVPILNQGVYIYCIWAPTVALFAPRVEISNSMSVCLGALSHNDASYFFAYLQLATGSRSTKYGRETPQYRS